MSFQLPANPLAYIWNSSLSMGNLPTNGNLPIEAKGKVPFVGKLPIDTKGISGTG